MTPETIRRMFDYTDWANERIGAALTALEPSQHTRALSGSYASVRDTFAHIVGAERIWLLRWKNQPPNEPPPWVKDGQVVELINEMRATAAERRERLVSLVDDQAADVVTYHNLKGDTFWTLRVGEMLMHVANHSTYHRGQIVSKLRELGAAPPATDFLIFASEMRAPK